MLYFHMHHEFFFSLLPAGSLLQAAGVPELFILVYYSSQTQRRFKSILNDDFSIMCVFTTREQVEVHMRILWKPYSEQLHSQIVSLSRKQPGSFCSWVR